MTWMTENLHRQKTKNKTEKDSESADLCQTHRIPIFWGFTPPVSLMFRNIGCIVIKVPWPRIFER